MHIEDTTANHALVSVCNKKTRATPTWYNTPVDFRKGRHIF